MNSKFLIAVIVILILGGGLFFYSNRNSANNSDRILEDSEDQQTATLEDQTMKQEDAAETTEDTTPMVSEDNKEMIQSNVKTFTVTAKPFTFSPGEIQVKKGDTVNIILDNQEGTHNFMLDEFNAKTRTLNAGETETIQFTADKTGTFEYYCGVGNHRAMGMVGKLIVE